MPVPGHQLGHPPLPVQRCVVVEPERRLPATDDDPGYRLGVGVPEVAVVGAEDEVPGVDGPEKILRHVGPAPVMAELHRVDGYGTREAAAPRQRGQCRHQHGREGIRAEQYRGPPGVPAAWRCSIRWAPPCRSASPGPPVLRCWAPNPVSPASLARRDRLPCGAGASVPWPTPCKRRAADRASATAA